jgi:hypothetical protein
MGPSTEPSMALEWSIRANRTTVKGFKELRIRTIVGKTRGVVRGGRELW